MKKRNMVHAKELKVIRSDNFQYVHTNVATITQSLNDASIIFSAIVPDPNRSADPNQLPVIEDRAVVSMSWEHLKTLGQVILANVHEYEKRFGITVPDINTLQPVIDQEDGGPEDEN